MCSLRKDYVVNHLDFWKYISSTLKQDQQLFLFIVADYSKGSPGKSGFKMALRDDYDFTGTIGGGAMEYKLIEWAKNSFQKPIHQNLLLPQHHSRAGTAWDSGMICDGSQSIIIIKCNSCHLKTVNQLIDCTEQNLQKYLYIDANSFYLTDSRDHPSDPNFKNKQQSTWAYSEVIGPEAFISIAGAGHVGKALCQVLSLFPFKVQVIDHRSHKQEMFLIPQAHQQIFGSYDQAPPPPPSSLETNFAVVVTTGYKTDIDAAKAFLGKKYSYIGIMGSPRKIEKIYQDLQRLGFSELELKALKAPIGISIKSETAMEIAVSICAEIIAIKNTNKEKRFQLQLTPEYTPPLLP